MKLGAPYIMTRGGYRVSDISDGHLPLLLCTEYPITRIFSRRCVGRLVSRMLCASLLGLLLTDSVLDDGSLRLYDLVSRRVKAAVRALGAEVASIACPALPDVWIACGQEVVKLFCLHQSRLQFV